MILVPASDIEIGRVFDGIVVIFSVFENTFHRFATNGC